jgi:ferredoxin
MCPKDPFSMHMHGVKINAGSATSVIKFICEDPHAVTGTDQKEHIVDAEVGHNVLEFALGAGINIEHACGGVCACSTCHVYIEEGMDLLADSTEAEEDRVEEAPDIRRNSRLACQCEILKPGKVVVRVPSWNRNAVKEIPH